MPLIFPNFHKFGTVLRVGFFVGLDELTDSVIAMNRFYTCKAISRDFFEGEEGVIRRFKKASPIRAPSGANNSLFLSSIFLPLIFSKLPQIWNSPESKFFLLGWMN